MVVDPYHGDAGLEGDCPVDGEGLRNGRACLTARDGGEVCGVWRAGAREGRATTSSPAAGIRLLAGTYRAGLLQGRARIIYTDGETREFYCIAGSVVDLKLSLMIWQVHGGAGAAAGPPGRGGLGLPLQCWPAVLALLAIPPRRGAAGGPGGARVRGDCRSHHVHLSRYCLAVIISIISYFTGRPADLLYRASRAVPACPGHSRHPHLRLPQAGNRAHAQSYRFSIVYVGSAGAGDSAPARFTGAAEGALHPPLDLFPPSHQGSVRGQTGAGELCSFPSVL